MLTSSKMMSSMKIHLESMLQWVRIDGYTNDQRQTNIEMKDQNSVSGAITTIQIGNVSEFYSRSGKDSSMLNLENIRHIEKS